MTPMTEDPADYITFVQKRQKPIILGITLGDTHAGRRTLIPSSANMVSA